MTCVLLQAKEAEAKAIAHRVAMDQAQKTAEENKAAAVADHKAKTKAHTDSADATAVPHQLAAA